MHTLVYIRRDKSFNDSVMEFAKKKFAQSTIITVSEYFNGDKRIDMNKSQWDYCSKTQAFVDAELDLSKIIFRDRVLRNTPFKKAIVLIRRAAGNILEILKRLEIDSLVTYPIDNFIMDILIQVAQKKHISCYGVSNFFMADYKRLTLYGEHCPFRIPENKEIKNVLLQLQQNFRSHMAPNKTKALRAAIVRYCKYKVRYPVFYVLMHKILKRNEYDLPCTPHNTTVRNVLNFLVGRHFTSVKKIDFTKKSILLPLHYFPEATIEYWSGVSTQIEFEDMLRCKIDELSDRYEQIILKEHPATVYDNTNAFYARLKENPKVVMVDPFVSTNALLEHVDVVGCWTGTAGIEALVNGKCVELFVVEQYYRQALNLHPEIIQQNGELISINDPFTFVGEILKGCIPREK